MKSIAILTVFPFLFLFSQPGSAAQYAVKGRLFCPEDPQAAANANLRLYDDDPGKDDTLMEGHPDQNGNFELSGSASDYGGGDMDVKFKIRHFCMAGQQREFKFELPKKYINKGMFDFGMMNLEMEIDAKESTEFSASSAFRNTFGNLFSGKK